MATTVEQSSLSVDWFGRSLPLTVGWYAPQSSEAGDFTTAFGWILWLGCLQGFSQGEGDRGSLRRQPSQLRSVACGKATGAAEAV